MGNFSFFQGTPLQDAGRLFGAVTGIDISNTNGPTALTAQQRSNTIKTLGSGSSSGTSNRQTNSTGSANEGAAANAGVYAGGGGGGSSVDANALSQLAQSGSILQSALDRLPGQLGIAQGNVNRQYDTQNNELQSNYNQSENTYNRSGVENQQNLRGNKNVINDQASSGLRGLQRLLGSYGAVGSDMGLAGRAVSDVASAQNAGAGQTFAQNQSSLDTNWGNYKNSADNERRKLNDWKTQQLNNAEAQSLTAKQDLLSKLADIRGQEASARGGNFSAATQPFIDQASSLSSRIDSLGAINPTYTGNTPVYNAAELSSYDTGNGATIGQDAATGGGMNTPFLNMLLGRDRRNQQLY